MNWTGEPHATVKLKLDFDGSIVVLTGAADIGQGSSTVLVQTVAEVLGLDIGRVRIVSGDSDVVPKDNGSYSSRVTFIVGNAAIDAANKLKGLLIAAAARKLEAEPGDIECLGEVYRAGAQDKGLTFEEVVTEALKDSGTITVTGTYSTIPESHGGKKYRGAAIGGTMGYSYSAQVVEVTVDEETGEVRVDKVWVAHDCGKALNRLTVEGQVQGSVWMGMGQAMSEETGYHDGLLVTANMLDYRVPTIQDSPPIEVGIVESNDPHGPFGAKEAGEGSLAAFLPALTNAIADATGLRFNDLPVTPDRVFAAIDKRQRDSRAEAQRGAPDGSVWPSSSLLRPDDARRRAGGARGPSAGAAAGRRHRPHRQYAPRHRRPADPDRHERRRRAARHPGRRRARSRSARPSTLAEVARARRRPRALSRGGAGRGLHRRAHASQHGHRRRQPLPRHALHLLQSERMVAPRQQPLPQDHRRHVPRGAQEPRRVLCHLQRRPGARPDDARRRGRSRRRRGQAHAAAARSSTSATRATTARPRATASTTWRCGRARSSPPCARGRCPACARPTTRSASAARSSIRSRASPWRCAARATRSPTCASPSPAPIPRPVLLEGTHELCGGPLDERVFKGLDELVRDQIMSMKTTFTPGHYRRRVAGVLARRLLVRLFGADPA